MYKSLILSILLYNSETWTLKETDKRRLRVFEMSVLRRILGISIRDRWRNNDIRERLHMEQDVISMIQRRRLLYFGHVNRMKENRILYITLHGRVHGTRSIGRPRRWIDGIKDDCDEMGLSLLQAFNITNDRNRWKELLMSYRGALGCRKGHKFKYVQGQVFIHSFSVIFSANYRNRPVAT